MIKQPEMEYRLFCLLVCFGLCLNFCVCQDTSGFIRIDCGSDNPSLYKDDLSYSTDAGFINSGKNFNISASYNDTDISDVPQLANLRSFPDGQRNCYDLSASLAGGAKGKKYIIRVRFLYGNYDGKNRQPIFDMYLGVEYWYTREKDAYAEIIHIFTSNYVYVCLVNTGNGTPFISALELLPLNANAYDPNFLNSLWLSGRYYLAPGSSTQTIRFW